MSHETRAIPASARKPEKEVADLSYNHYDRLTALDSAFLGIEDGNAHMHIGAVALFDVGPLAAGKGGIDFERIVEGAPKPQNPVLF